jgi:hypothetical protein
MPTIAKDNDVVTLINVFTVQPGHQQRLVDVLANKRWEPIPARRGNSFEATTSSV